MVPPSYEGKLFVGAAAHEKPQGISESGWAYTGAVGKTVGCFFVPHLMAETEGIELRPEEIVAIRKILAAELAKSISLALEFQASA